MEYPKQKKTKWWLILLFIPLLVGCSPVTQSLLTFFVYIGNQLTPIVVGQTIEIVFDKLRDYFSDHVIVDVNNPLKGTYSGDLRFEGETANCKYSYVLKKPRMFRTSIDGTWNPISEAKTKVQKSFEENC